MSPRRPTHRVLRTEMRRTIRSTWPRWVSIACLMMLGAFAFVGIKVAGPDMRATAQRFYDETRLADATVTSTWGLSGEDEAAIRSADGVREAEFGYRTDVVVSGTSEALRMLSTPATLSVPVVVDGRMPSKAGEIALDFTMAGRYAIGDWLGVEEAQAAKMGTDDVLRRHSFTIVGFAKSPEFLTKGQLGSTNIGTGQLKGFGYVVPAVFDSDVTTIARLRFEGTEGLGAYSDEYGHVLDQRDAELTPVVDARATARLGDLKAQKQEEIDDGRTKLADARKKLTEAQQQVDDAEAQLDASRQQLADARAQYQGELTSGRQTLEQARSALSQAEGEIATRSQELGNAQAKLSQSRIAASNAQTELAAKQKELDAGRAKLTQLDGAIAQAQASGQDATALQTERAALADQVAKGQQQWEDGTADLAALQDDIERGQREFDAGSAELEAGRAQLDAQRQQVQQGQTQADNQAAAGQQQLDSAQHEIDSGAAELDQRKQELATETSTAEKEIADKTAELDAAQKDLDALAAPKFTVADRRDDTPYSMYGDTSTRVDVLARVFPVLLFGVAAMVSLVTMTRMVDEERSIDGTHAAMGYGRRSITQKYLVYGASAAIVGALIGIVIGHTLLPTLIFNAYSATSILDSLDLHVFPVESLISLAVALACTLAVSYVVARKQLQEVPARLLQPKPPRAGTRILLERLPLLWNRMSFTQKVTWRNLFRYKRRALMTMFGVLGCTALLVCGLGLRDSVMNIVSVQFDELVHYDLIAVRSDDATEAQTQKVEDDLGSDDHVTAHADVRYQGLHTRSGDDVARADVTTISPVDMAGFGDYVTLRSPRAAGRGAIDLTGARVVLTEAIANSMDAGVGDEVTLLDADDVEHTFRVGAITEMYVGNYLFLSPDAYSAAFPEDAASATGNASLVRLDSSSPDALDAASARLMGEDAMAGVVPVSAMKNAIGGFMDGVTTVVGVMIAAAILLALVVVFNLTNINVSERIRELSTIKVLGFYPLEVTMYVFREIFLLTGLGIAVGFWAGNMLHAFIARELPPEGVRLIPGVEPVVYLWSALITLASTVLVALLMHRKLANIDMLGALKSVD